MNEKQIEEIINNCYLRILKRKPDTNGLKHYLDLMKKGEINKEKLEQVLRNSDIQLLSLLKGGYSRCGANTLPVTFL